jgi:hypothetical protein
MMFTHLDLMLDLAKQRNAELIESARRFRMRRRALQESLPRPAPVAVVDLELEKLVSPAGTLSVCEMPRELTAGRAR